MTLDDYQSLSARFAGYDDSRRWALKLCAEAGEVAQWVERDEWHWDVLGRPPGDPEELKLELGDVLWYLAALARNRGMSLSEVAEANIAKLERRHGVKK